LALRVATPEDFALTLHARRQRPRARFAPLARPRRARPRGRASGSADVHMRRRVSTLAVG